jgi:UDP-2,4-diacetamido-2,4,6-trideoxy-beta-L-altropyranose hydrolase
MTMPLIVFRADGGPATGAGHVMRTLALASAFRDGGWSVGFAATEETFASVAALNGWPLERLALGPDAAGESDAMRRRWPGGADILVVDHYGRDAALERTCRGWARRIVVIDDLADRPHDADVLVDVANPPEAYRGLVPKACAVLTGPDYAIVNGAFRAARARALARRGSATVERILVSFGQIDALNATQRALAALAAAGFAGEVDVVLGRAAPHLDAVRAAAGPSTRLHVDADNMSELMTMADLAIGAGGVTALERCCLGLPSALVTVANNQREIVALLASAGAAVSAGDMDDGLEARLAGALKDVLKNATARTAMAKVAAELVDGRGVERIALAGLGSCATKRSRPVTLRPAEMEDEAWLLKLQSQPQTRRYANNPYLPTTEGHRQWLAQTLADPSRLLLVAEADGSPVGMLRLDRLDHGDRVSIAVDPQYHRQGLGAAILSLATMLRPGVVLDAEVMPENEPSLTLFAAAGYQRVGERLFRRGSG